MKANFKLKTILLLTALVPTFAWGYEPVLPEPGQWEARLYKADANGVADTKAEYTGGTCVKSDGTWYATDRNSKAEVTKGEWKVVGAEILAHGDNTTKPASHGAGEFTVLNPRRMSGRWQEWQGDTDNVFTGTWKFVSDTCNPAVKK